MKIDKYIYDFLNARTLAVLSTVNDSGVPEAAVIGFGQNEKLEVIFGTDRASRKYSNMITNPKVALVIGWENGETVQYEGLSRELEVDEISFVKDTYWAKSPQAEVQYKNPGQRYFIVTPLWIRHTDLKTKPWTIKELPV
jgi:uncharacterized pyridoxamine 5'-phosphate oxidase family protein